MTIGPGIQCWHDKSDTFEQVRRYISGNLIVDKSTHDKDMYVNVVSRLKFVMQIACALLPGSAKKFLYRQLFGWAIGPNVSIGISVITAKRVSLARDSRIGHFNVIRNLPNLELDEGSTIGQWNWITCGEFFTEGIAKIPPPSKQGLFLEPNSAVTSRHYLDCPGGMFVGEFSVVAGVRSTFLTHSVDIATSTQRCDPIQIGKYCFIGSNVVVTPGVSVADYVVVGAGSVVVKDLPETKTLYAGSPARSIRDLEDGEYFRRKTRSAQ